MTAKGKIRTTEKTEKGKRQAGARRSREFIARLEPGALPGGLELGGK